MKKGTVLEGVVQKLKFPNKGILLTEDGREVVVKHTLPGQRVSVMVNKVRKGKCEGKVLEIIEKSPMELATAACPHFGVCGGCSYQNISYERQLALKEEQVRELLAPVLAEYGTDFEACYQGIKGSPRQSEYRNKMEFSFGDTQKDGPLALGMHRRGSFYDIAQVGQCQIVDGDFRKILACVQDFFCGRQIAFYHKMRHEGYLRHLLVRKAEKTGEILIDLVTSTQAAGFCEHSLLEEMAERLLDISCDGQIVGILHTKNDSPADVIRNDGTDILYGKDHFFEELLGLTFKITPFSFFQTNSSGAEVLYETVRAFACDVAGESNRGTIFDLYSGTGTIAQILSAVAQKVVGVEIVGEAVEAARENAQRNGLSNCEFIAGDVLKVIDTLSDRPDFVILDPPRDGIHPKALLKIGRDMRAEHMIYVSCKPTSLARDLKALQECGYRVRKVCCVDMFPGTCHTECVVWIQRKHI